MSDWVFMRRNPQRWRKLSTSIQMSLIDARDRISRIRDSISSTALVRTMPPIEIHDVVWVSSDLTVIGSANSYPIKIGASVYFGARISGPAAIYASDVEVRGIMLHEFSHCFNTLRRLYRHMKSGSQEDFSSSKPENNSDEELDRWDRSLLEKPEDWFSSEDCGIFPYHHSSLTQECTNTIFREWVAKGLPTAPHLTTYDLGKVWIQTEDDVENRIRQLEGDPT